MTCIQLFIVPVFVCVVLLVAFYIAISDCDDADEIDTFFD